MCLTLRDVVTMTPIYITVDSNIYITVDSNLALSRLKQDDGYGETDHTEDK